MNQQLYIVVVELYCADGDRYNWMTYGAFDSHDKAAEYAKVKGFRDLPNFLHLEITPLLS